MTVHLARILVPIDGRTDIEPAVETAFKLAARYGAEVEVLSSAQPFIKEFVVPIVAGGIWLRAMVKEAEVRSRTSAVRAEQKFSTIAQLHSEVRACYIALKGSVSESVTEGKYIARIRKDTNYYLV